MKKVIFTILTIVVISQLFGNELSQPDPDVTKRITAFIQYTSEYRFGNDLKEGDEVVYKIEGIKDDPVFGVHILKVIDKNEKTTTVLEIFEGNKLFVEFTNDTKKVIKIWGFDIEGGEHNLELLSFNEIEKVLGINESNIAEIQKFIEWDYVTTNNQRTADGEAINCKSLKLRIKKNELSKNIQDVLIKLQEIEKIVLSDEVPKLLPLVPVAVLNLDKKNLLSRDNAGFVSNKNLKLKSFIKN